MIVCVDRMVFNRKKKKGEAHKYYVNYPYQNDIVYQNDIIGEMARKMGKEEGRRW